MSIRDSFVAQFGETTAICIEAAANEHKNGVHDKPGSDPFKWAIAIAIGYECMSKDEYRDYHGITPPWTELDQWIKDHADLKSHDGDVDYLAAMTGVYQEYV